MASQVMLLRRVTYHTCVMRFSVSIECRARNAALKYVIATKNIFLMVPIIIIHHENISIEIIVVPVSCILSPVLNKTIFFIMAALICIINSQGCRSDNPTGFHQ